MSLTSAPEAAAFQEDTGTCSGQFDSGEDIAALRRFVGLTQTQFALAMGISVHTLRNWEQGRRHPEGPAIALLRIAARHPRIIRENVENVDLPERRSRCLVPSVLWSLPS